MFWFLEFDTRYLVVIARDRLSESLIEFPESFLILLCRQHLGCDIYIRCRGVKHPTSPKATILLALKMQIRIKPDHYLMLLTFCKLNLCLLFVECKTGTIFTYLNLERKGPYLYCSCLQYVSWLPNFPRPLSSFCIPKSVNCLFLILNIIAY